MNAQAPAYFTPAAARKPTFAERSFDRRIGLSVPRTAQHLKPGGLQLCWHRRLAAGRQTEKVGRIRLSFPLVAASLMAVAAAFAQDRRRYPKAPALREW